MGYRWTQEASEACNGSNSLFVHRMCVGAHVMGYRWTLEASEACNGSTLLRVHRKYVYYSSLQKTKRGVGVGFM